MRRSFQSLLHVGYCRRRFSVGPIVLFSTACAVRPYTPSMNTYALSEEVPPSRQQLLPSYGSVYVSWQLPPQNPWAPYQKATLMASLEDGALEGFLPDIRELGIVHEAEIAAQRVAEFGLPEDALWVVDLRGAASVAFGSTLSQVSPAPVSLVPTFNNWPAVRETVPAEETLAALISYRPRLPDPALFGTRPVFLLDSFRLAFRDEALDDDAVDNRYFLTPADLPDAAMLRAQGIRRVIYVVAERAHTQAEEDDLHATFLAYQQAGIVLSMVDLPFLAGLGDPGQLSWQERLRPREILIGPRTTIVNDPAFFIRSRGGFGGAHAGPSPFHSGTGFFGGGHGGG